mmetsp:Transcript_22615/g.70866  ORF Transcript_22615/g.70866 Transcript_22615/m.70866 type:complete len:201 (+) Transcript_22615:1058-1660(+)
MDASALRGGRRHGGRRQRGRSGPRARPDGGGGAGSVVPRGFHAARPHARARGRLARRHGRAHRRRCAPRSHVRTPTPAANREGAIARTIRRIPGRGERASPPATARAGSHARCISAAAGTARWHRWPPERALAGRSPARGGASHQPDCALALSRARGRGRGGGGPRSGAGCWSSGCSGRSGAAGGRGSPRRGHCPGPRRR